MLVMFCILKKSQPLSVEMDTDKTIISLNQQKKYEELTNLVKNTSTEEVKINATLMIIEMAFRSLQNNFTTFVHLHYYQFT